ncbi:MAG: hypothetical protein IKF38_01895 [Clostridia bacterium]|nr:hypothetical protein [Clostridia bacterium]
MGKEKQRLVILMEDIAQMDLPFEVTKDGRHVMYADPEDMSLLMSRLSRLVTGFVYHFGDGEDSYIQITANGKQTDRIYIKHKSEYKRFK